MASTSDLSPAERQRFIMNWLAEKRTQGCGCGAAGIMTVVPRWKMYGRPAGADGRGGSR